MVESFNTFVAQVVELSMTDDGPKVHKVWCAVDCGVAVNPDIIRAQMEGGIGFGLGHILYAEQTLDAGAPVSGNFDTYRSLRINEMPEIEVVIVKSTEKPSGVGEPGVPPLEACRCQRAGETRSGKTAAVADRTRSLSMSLFKNSMLALVAGGLAAGLLAFAEPSFQEADAAVSNPTKLQSVSAFAKIKNKNERAVALFTEAGKVIQSPRCMNCHPATERPTQTDRMRPHIPLVVRGEGGVGAAGGLACATCHHENNFDAANVPGNPKWALAPIEMAWQGKTLARSAPRSRTRSAMAARTWPHL